TLLLLAGLLSIFLFLTASYWNNKIFGDNLEYLIVFKVLALVLPGYGLSVFFIAIINGLGKFKKVISINIVGNIMGLMASLFLITQFKTIGALMSIVITPALLFFVTFYLIQKEIQFFQI